MRSGSMQHDPLANRRPPGRPAFTLAELLVTMTIMALLTVSIVSSTRALASTRTRIDERLAASSCARQALEAIVAALRNVRRDPDRERPLIVGRNESQGLDRIDLQVISDTAARREASECDQYEVGFYVWQRDEDGVPVLLCRRRNGLSDRPGAGGIATVVAEGIVSLTFCYYSDGQWQNEWLEGEPGIPEAVRVTVAAAGVPPQRSSRPVSPVVFSTIVPIRANPPAELAQSNQPGQPGQSGQPGSAAAGPGARGGPQ